MIKQIKLSNEEKEKLSRLKGRTGIKNWNVLCRWALCYSLAEKSIPTDIPLQQDSNVEMSWQTFAGEYDELYYALVKGWCLQMGLPTDEATVDKYFKLNLDRGIKHLTGTGFIKNLDTLVELVLEK